jgi:hypothetical protein
MGPPYVAMDFMLEARYASIESKVVDTEDESPTLATYMREWP